MALLSIGGNNFPKIKICNKLLKLIRELPPDY